MRNSATPNNGIDARFRTETSPRVFPFSRLLATDPPQPIGGREPSEWGERFQFFRAWLSNPMGVGALLPSSNALGKAITAEIHVGSAPVIELGPGTGVFTRAMIARGIPEDRISMVEADPKFAGLLRTRHPSARVHCMDATRLREVQIVRGGVGAVLSGLPLLSMSPSSVSRILEGAFRHLRPMGALYLFTYGLGCPIHDSILSNLKLTATRTNRVFANLPPASIYRVTRQAGN
jgi:phospholipid N-methyltransferase